MVTPTLDPPTTGPTGEAPKAHPVFGLTRLKNWTDPIKKERLKQGVSLPPYKVRAKRSLRE